MNTSRQLDKNKVRRSFGQAVDTYDEAAVVQQRMADELVDRLDVLTISPDTILEAGCGSGYALPALARSYPGASIVALDFADPMLRTIPVGAGGRVMRVCGDAERMPLAGRSVDMVFCNAVLEWCELDAALDEFQRVLKPGGLLTFATLGPDTLVELTAAWRQIDDEVHVHRFIDMHHIGDALVARGFAFPVMDVDYLTVTHGDVASVVRDLKAQGARNAAAARQAGLTGRGKFERLQQLSHAMRNTEGLIESTCEIIYGHAWAPEQLRMGDGRVEVPLDGLTAARS